MKRAVTAVLGIVCVVLAQSCSGHVDEGTGSGAQALSGGCGGVQESADSNGTQGDVLLGSAKHLIVPSSVAASSESVVVNDFLTATLSFWLQGSPTYCTYSRAEQTGQTGAPLPFIGCGGGLGAGADVVADQVGLSATVTSQSTDHFVANAVVAYDIDDGNPCTTDLCSNGVISHPSVADGTIVDDGDLCNGTEYCLNGSITSDANKPPTKIHSGCVELTCDDSVGGYVSDSSGCTPVSGVGSTYPGPAGLPSDISQGMQVLYGDQPGIQTSSMDTTRLAVIRGRVVTRDDISPSPLSGITIRILGHTEFGSTTTRADGGYDMVVNGGPTYVVQFTCESPSCTAGYLTSQRQAKTRWLDWTALSDVALITPEVTTSVDFLTGNQNWTVVRHDSHNDGDGSREATILIPPGTTISSCTGTTNCLNGQWQGGGTGLSVHATEYTVGSAGPSAMPGDLPPQSGYTYAVDTGILEAGDTSVTFSNSYAGSTGKTGDVFFYLENFLAIPYAGGAGSGAVPAGSYDKTRGVWSPELSGKVYCIINITNGLAVMGTDCGTALTPDGSNNYNSESPPITQGERQQLASIYTSPNTSVWRVPLPHFSGFDLNWGAGPPNGAQQPPSSSPHSSSPSGNSPLTCGSIIECENQVLRESIPIAGTPYTLNYRSETQRGYHPTITVPVTVSGPLPATLPTRIEAEIQIAGQRVVLQGDPSAAGFVKPQSLSWSWDRTDAYGRPISGAVPAHVEVRYVYKAVPFVDGSFASYSSTPVSGGNRPARELWYARDYDLIVGALDDEGLGLGGWTISAHHVYQSGSGTLFRGDGRKQDSNDSPAITHHYFDDGLGSATSYIEDFTVAPDASVWLLHSRETLHNYDYLARIENGSLAIKTSSSETPGWQDGDPIGSVALNDVTDGRNVITEPNGDLLVADKCRILRVVPVSLTDIRVDLVAGNHDDNCSTSFAPDGDLAAGTSLASTWGLAEAAGGSIFFVEYESASGTSRVRGITPDGKLETLIGAGASDISACTTTCAASSKLGSVGSDFSIAARDDGTVLLLDGRSGAGGNRVWALSSKNTQGAELTLFAGNSSGTNGHQGDGYAATNAAVKINGASQSYLSAVGSDLFIPSYNGDDTVRRVDATGIITTFAGKNLVAGPYGDGLFANETPLRPKRVVLGPDGYYYTTADDGSTGQATRIVRFHAGQDPPPGSYTLVPSSDGSEVYEFDSSGLHRKTYSKWSGATLMDLTDTTKCGGPCYDGDDHVLALPDVGGKTTITGYGTGTVTIQPPVGQPTVLHIDASGYLHTLDDAATNVWTFNYDATSHMLTQLIEPKDASEPGKHTHSFAWSPSGLLTNDTAPSAGAGIRLSRVDGASSYTIDYATAESHGTTHLIDLTPSSNTFTDLDLISFNQIEQRTRTTMASSTPTVDTWFTDTAHVQTLPDGTTTTTSFSPDPRFGSAVPFVSMRTTTNTYHPGTGTSCQLNWNADCELTTRTSDGVGFAATTVTEKRYGTFNDYSQSAADVTTWSKTGSADPACNSSPCIVHVSPEGRKTVYGNLDPSDRVTMITPAIDSAIHIAYGTSGSELGKIISIVQGTRSYAIHHDANGFPSAIDTPLGTSEITFDNVDSDGQVHQEKFHGPGSTVRIVNMDYDENGNRKSLQVPDGQTHNFTYNGLNLLAHYTPPNNGWYTDVLYDYDLDGLVRDTNEPSGGFVTNTRDGAGRVTQITYSHPYSGTITLTMNYDPTTGQPCTSTAQPAAGCSATNGWLAGTNTVTTTDAYDGDRLKSETTQFVTPAVSHTINWSYDDAFRLHSRDIDGQGFTTTTFNHDYDGYVANVHNNHAVVINGTTNYDVWRDNSGRVVCTSIGTTTGHAVCQKYTYDTCGALTEQRAVNSPCSDAQCSQSGTELLDIQYARTADPIGRVKTKTERADFAGSCTWSYTYDTVYTRWLSNASETGSTYCTSSPVNQSYDADGNVHYPGWHYDPQDRFTGDGTWSYTYDSMGNVRSEHDGGSWYGYAYYDPFGNLRHFSTTTGLSTDYDIDIRNRRVGKFRNGSSTFSEGYLYDGSRVAAHLTGSNATVDAAYVYVTKPNVPDLILGSGWQKVIISDQLGTVRRVYDIQAGTTYLTMNSDTYGIATTWPNSSAVWPSGYVPFGFAGGLWDGDVGVYRFGARDYNPWWGRWWSKDPIRFDGGLNLYGYCDNDPVNCTDAYGTAPSDFIRCITSGMPLLICIQGELNLTPHGPFGDCRNCTPVAVPGGGDDNDDRRRWGNVNDRVCGNRDTIITACAQQASNVFKQCLEDGELDWAGCFKKAVKENRRCRRAAGLQFSAFDLLFGGDYVPVLVAP